MRRIEEVENAPWRLFCSQKTSAREGERDTQRESSLWDLKKRLFLGKRNLKAQEGDHTKEQFSYSKEILQSVDKLPQSQLISPPPVGF